MTIKYLLNSTQRLSLCNWNRNSKGEETTGKQQTKEKAPEIVTGWMLEGGLAWIYYQAPKLRGVRDLGFIGTLVKLKLPREPGTKKDASRVEIPSAEILF